MSILLDKSTRVLVQGITGREGHFHTEQMQAYGTQVVGGVTPGKGGTETLGLPVFDTVRAAVAETGATASCIFVPAAFAADSILEAADSDLELIVCITEGIPVQDMVGAVNALPELAQQRSPVLIGPNCPGLMTPGQAKMGIIPNNLATPGPVGIISRSGTLTYEAVFQLTHEQLGQSTCIGIGGDPIIGSSFSDLLALFESDPGTEGIVLIGEIGGTAEEEAAALVRARIRKPVVGFIAGRTAPAGRRMGHAGAIVAGGQGTAEGKIAAFRAAGIHVAESPAEIGVTMRRALGR